jgi:Ca2+-transporting ATPase
VLRDNCFTTLPTAVHHGFVSLARFARSFAHLEMHRRAIYDNIRCFLRFQLTTSVAAIALLALSVGLRLPSPLNAIQLLFINACMDGPLAQSLGVEAPDDDIMLRRPRRASEHVLTRGMLCAIFSSGAWICACTLVLFWHMLYTEGRDEVAARTFTFVVFILFQFFQALSCRSLTRTVFSPRSFSNGLFWLAVAVCTGVLVAAVHIPVVQALFHTSPLSLRDWMVATTAAASVLLIDEARKMCYCCAAR